MQGTVPGVRKQGRPKMRWIDDVEKRKKMQFEKVLRETENRWRWGELVHEATNPWKENGYRQNKTRLSDQCLRTVTRINVATL